MKNIEELKIEEQLKEKTFYIGVSDYEGGDMFVDISEKLDNYILAKSRVYKIVIPTKKSN